MRTGPRPRERIGSSKIKIGIVRGRGNAGHVVGEDRAETGARLDPRIPFLGGLVGFPRHVAEIIKARQLCSGGDVSDRKMVAGQPSPTLDEITDIVEVVWKIGMPGSDRLRIRLPVSEKALHHLSPSKFSVTSRFILISNQEVRRR